MPSSTPASYSPSSVLLFNDREMLATEQLVTELKDHTYNVQLPDLRDMRRKENPFVTSASLLRAAVKSTSMMIPFPHEDSLWVSSKPLSRGPQKRASTTCKRRELVHLSDISRGKDSDSPGERNGVNVNGNSTTSFPKISPHSGLLAKEPLPSSNMAGKSEVPKLPSLDLTRCSKQSPHKVDLSLDPAKISLAHSAKVGASFKPPPVSDSSPALASDLLRRVNHHNASAQPTEPSAPMMMPSEPPQEDTKKKPKRKKSQKKKVMIM